MNDWQSTWLGRRSLPRDLSGFEIEAFFNFSDAERRVIEERRGPALKIALALQIGFLRMTGRLLEAVRMVPPALWQHLGKQFDVAPPELASLRATYRRRRTLFEHQEVACTVSIEHSLAFRDRETLFIPQPLWEERRRAHYRRLSLPTDPKAFLEPLASLSSAKIQFTRKQPRASIHDAAHQGRMRPERHRILRDDVAKTAPGWPSWWPADREPRDPAPCAGDRHCSERSSTLG
jgi:Domain of unknown function (DUF4158)